MEFRALGAGEAKDGLFGDNPSFESQPDEEAEALFRKSMAGFKAKARVCVARKQENIAIRFLLDHIQEGGKDRQGEMWETGVGELQQRNVFFQAGCGNVK